MNRAGLDASSSPAVGGAGLPSAVKRVLVLGAGRSGIGASLALARLGVEVIVSDRCNPEALPGLADALAAGVLFVPEESLQAEDRPMPDLVVKSPGIPAEAAPVALARSRGVPVWSELELAWALFRNPFVAITGTNGKTTTTALIGHLFAVAGRPVHVLGNIGVAVTSAADEIAAGEELVVEVSSFQLEDIHAFRPAVGVFLNLTPDHIDRHGTLERYVACKAMLFANQRAGDVAVLNAADPAVAALGRELAARPDGPRLALFSTGELGGRGGDAVESAYRAGEGVNGGKGGGEGVDGTGGIAAVPSTPATHVGRAVSRPGRPRGGSGLSPVCSWIEAGRMIFDGEPLLRIDEIRIPGLHNLENCLAAGTAALARGVDREAVAEGLRTFTGVAHRLERAGMIDGVTYVNDSKATNVEATLTALKAYPKNTHLILGGRDKASDYRPVARACAEACRAVYLLGEATPLIEEAFARVREEEGLRSATPLRLCGDLETAVRAAAEAAKPGDVVLLAPACASFDQYRSFEERGDHFKQVVGRLAEEGS